MEAREEAVAKAGAERSAALDEMQAALVRRERALVAREAEGPFFVAAGTRPASGSPSGSSSAAAALARRAEAAEAEAEAARTDAAAAEERFETMREVASSAADLAQRLEATLSKQQALVDGLAADRERLAAELEEEKDVNDDEVAPPLHSSEHRREGDLEWCDYARSDRQHKDYEIEHRLLTGELRDYVPRTLPVVYSLDAHMRLVTYL